MQGELTQPNMSLQGGGDNEVTISQKGTPGMKKCQESPAGTNKSVAAGAGPTLHRSRKEVQNSIHDCGYFGL